MFRKGLTVSKFIVLLSIFALIFSFFIASTVWKIWRDHKYEPFIDGMIQAKSSNGMVPRYTIKVNGDTYYVKYPDFFIYHWKSGNQASG